ncbi:MAG: NAD-dependent epimerase/dehydratase family protein [Acidimicrobiales bacterium]
MKVLVTGGAGFIGSHLVDQLVAAGAQVRVVDRREPLWENGAADYLIGDLGEAKVAAAAVDRVDAVSHQAARVGLGVDMGDVTGYVADNDGATATMLAALYRRAFAGRLVLAASMVVYGEGLASCADHGPVRPAPRSTADLEAGRFEPGCPACGRPTEPTTLDEDGPTDPRNVYAATKLHQEHLCAVYGREAQVAVTALRYHNVYGPRMPKDTPYAGVASIFRSALAAGRPPQVFEDGGQRRDFVHVADVARANVLALTAPDPVVGPLNVASGQPRTVGDMAAALAAALGGGDPALAPVVTGRWRLGDVRHVVASPRRAAECLGFEAEMDFAAGMAELAADA